MTLAPTVEGLNGSGETNPIEGIINKFEEKRKSFLNSLRDKLDAFTGKKEQERPAALTEIADEAKKIFEETSIENVDNVNAGFAGLGFEINKFKNEKFRDGFAYAASTLGKDKNAGKFFKELSKIFDRDAKAADDSLEALKKDIKEGKNSFLSLKNMSGQAALIGNATMYGRLAFDIFGGGIAARVATRFGMGVAMATSVAAEAGKEMRANSEELINSTRVEDIDEAFEQAMKIYEIAKETDGKVDQNGNPSKESLDKAYQETIPMDILRRLAQNKKGTTNFVDKIFRWRIEKVAKKLSDQLDDINASSLSKEEKEIKKSNVLYGFLRSPMLKDFDRVVGQAGMVDRSFMLLRTLEQAGKLATYGMIGDTLIRSLWSAVPNLVSSVEAAETTGFSNPVAESVVAKPQVNDSSLNAGEVISNVDTKFAPLATFIGMSYEVKAGDNLTTIIYNQLRDSGMLKGLSREENLKIVETFKHKFEVADIKALGISSGNIDLIKPGEKIDLSLLNDKSVFEKDISWGTASTTPIVESASIATQGDFGLGRFDNLTKEELAARDGFQNPAEQVAQKDVSSPAATTVIEEKIIQQEGMSKEQFTERLKLNLGSVVLDGDVRSYFFKNFDKIPDDEILKIKAMLLGSIMDSNNEEMKKIFEGKQPKDVMIQPIFGKIELTLPDKVNGQFVGVSFDKDGSFDDGLIRPFGSVPSVGQITAEQPPAPVVDAKPVDVKIDQVSVEQVVASEPVPIVPPTPEKLSQADAVEQVFTKPVPEIAPAISEPEPQVSTTQDKIKEILAEKVNEVAPPLAVESAVVADVVVAGSQKSIEESAQIKPQEVITPPVVENVQKVEIAPTVPVVETVQKADVVLSEGITSTETNNDGIKLTEVELKSASEIYRKILDEVSPKFGLFGLFSKGGESDPSWQALAKENATDFVKKFMVTKEEIHMLDKPKSLLYSSDQGTKLAKHIFDFSNKGIKIQENESIQAYLDRAIRETVRATTEATNSANLESVTPSSATQEVTKGDDAVLQETAKEAVSLADIKATEADVNNASQVVEPMVQAQSIEQAPQAELKEQEKVTEPKPVETAKETPSTTTNQSGMEKLKVDDNLIKGVRPEDIQVPPVSNVTEAQPQAITTPVTNVPQSTITESVEVKQPPETTQTASSSQSIEQSANNFSNKDLKTLPFDKLPALTKEQEDTAFKFLGDTLKVIDKNGLLSTTRAVDTPLWKAIYDKPVDLMLGYMDKEARGRMINIGLIDKEYLERDSESYVRDVLKLNDSEIRTDTRLYNFNEKIKEFVKQGIRPFPEEKMQDYLRRVSRVMVLKK